MSLAVQSSPMEASAPMQWSRAEAQLLDAAQQRDETPERAQ